MILTTDADGRVGRAGSVQTSRPSPPARIWWQVLCAPTASSTRSCRSRSSGADGWRDRYDWLLAELLARIDLEMHDPWPRHRIASGASLAVTLAAYRRIGGLPPIPTGEDRALAEKIT